VLALSLVPVHALVRIPPSDEATDPGVVIHIEVAREAVYRLVLTPVDVGEAIVVHLALEALCRAVHMGEEDPRQAMREVDAGSHTLLAPYLAPFLVPVLRHILDDVPTLVRVRRLRDHLPAATLILAVGVGAEVGLPVAPGLCHAISLVQCLVQSREAEAAVGVSHEVQMCQLAVTEAVDKMCILHLFAPEFVLLSYYRVVSMPI